MAEREPNPKRKFEEMVVAVSTLIRVNQDYAIFETPHQILTKGNHCEGTVFTIVKRTGRSKQWQPVADGCCDECRVKLPFPLSVEKIQELISARNGENVL